jgi:hypothetical protein
MIYFANASTVGVRAEMMRNVRLGQIITPAERRHPIGTAWIADNSVFGGKYPGNRQFVSWLASLPYGGKCLFAVAPDVVGDHEATLHRSLPMLATLRAVCGSVAFVAQNGATPSWVPWPEFDALFLGGTTEWKLGADARELVAAARRQGKWVHMGRVNSARRFAYASAIGCHSADGTYLAFGPDVNLPRVLTWFDRTPMWDALHLFDASCTLRA